MSEHNITIIALGRVAALGTLYDERSNQFLSYSLFNNEIPEGLIKSTDVPSTDLTYDYENTFKSKSESLNLSAQLKLSFMGGLGNLEGSGKYLSDKKESHKSVKCNLIYNITTKCQQLDLSQKSIKGLINYDSLELSNSTHVVTGIKWGAKTIASFEYSNKEDEAKTVIEGKLKLDIEMLGGAIKAGAGKGAVGINNNEKSLMTKLNINFRGDVISDELLPQTYEDVLVVMKKIPELIKKFNDGKGSCLEFTLSPLEVFRKFVSTEILDRRKVILINNIDKVTIHLVERTLDNLLKATQIQFDEIVHKDEKIQESETFFRQNLSESLLSVRSGEMKPVVFEKLLTDFNASECSPKSIIDFIDKYDWLKAHFKQISDDSKNGIFYPGRNESINIRDLNLRDVDDAYLLYFNKSLSLTTLYIDNYNHFKDLKKKQDATRTSKYVRINYDLHPDAMVGDQKIKLLNYKKGILSYGIYDGQMLNGIRQGKGKYVWANGDVYDGQWHDGKMQGKGKKVYANGDVYDGQWHDGKKQGKGKLVWANGDVYDGQWHDGKRQGKGKFVAANGDVYDGQWHDGKKQGEGKYVDANGNVYDGQWHDGKRQGKGKNVWADGDVYDGQWHDGKKQGQGKYLFANGDVYDGQWHDGKKQDNCTIM